MTLQDYSTEELRAELKRRNDLVKAEKGQSEKMQRKHCVKGVTNSMTQSTEKRQ